MKAKDVAASREAVWRRCWFGWVNEGPSCRSSFGYVNTVCRRFLCIPVEPLVLLIAHVAQRRFVIGRKCAYGSFGWLPMRPRCKRACGSFDRVAGQQPVPRDVPPARGTGCWLKSEISLEQTWSRPVPAGECGRVSRLRLDWPGLGFRRSRLGSTSASAGVVMGVLAALPFAFSFAFGDLEWRGVWGIGCQRAVVEPATVV